MEPETSESESENEQMEVNDGDRLSDEEYPISDDNVTDGEQEEKTSGWATSMAKILRSEKTEVLSKAKKVEDIEKKKIKKSYDFQIDGAEEESDDTKPKNLERLLQKKKYRERRENKLRVYSLRIKPSVTDLDRERTFRKIGTKGVVQLFNAVNTQQSEVNRKLGGTKLESKREEIIRSADNKKHFLDVLMTGPRSKSELVDRHVKKEKKREDSSDEESDDDDEAKESNWSALRNDFMTGKKIGWDKDDSEEDNEEENESLDSDSD